MCSSLYFGWAAQSFLHGDDWEDVAAHAASLPASLVDHFILTDTSAHIKGYWLQAYFWVSIQYVPKFNLFENKKTAREWTVFRARTRLTDAVPDGVAVNEIGVHPSDVDGYTKAAVVQRVTSVRRYQHAV